MGRASLIQTNFTGGELSPALALGRVDIAKYNNGVKRLENCVLTVQGGAKRRPGTRFIAESKFQDKTSRLIDFIYNRGQAYMLEMGEGYIRFLKNRAVLSSGGTPIEVATPFGENQLQEVNYVQKADTGFFVHEMVYPRRLQRFSDLQWGLAPIGFITPAFEEQGHYPAGTLAFSGNVPDTTITVSSSDPIFMLSDVGRHILYGGGDAFIIGFTDAYRVTAEVRAPFPTLGAPATAWNLNSSPQTSITPSAVGAIGETITLSSQTSTLEAAQAVVSVTRATTDSLDLEVTGHGYAEGDLVVITEADAGEPRNGSYVVSAVPDANHIRIPLAQQPFGALSVIGTDLGKVQRSTSSGGVEVWRASDLGSLVQINGGLVRITEVVNAQLVKGEVIRSLTSEVTVGANGWTLETNAWNAVNGYPRAVTINNQRLLFAGSPGYPQTVWGSEIAGYLSFSFGVDDDDAFRFQLDGPRNSPIRHLAPARQLLVLTESDEMSLKGGQEKPITPTNIQKTDESTVGSSAARPVKIGNEMLYVQAAGRKVCAIGYRYEIDGFASPDRTVFSSHITGPGIVQLAHQKEPDSTIYAVRTDGVLATCAYDIDQEVTGWGRWLTQGAFESVATIPTATGEDAYTVVRRTIAGGTRRFIEVFDPDMLVDCGISGTNPAGQATWTGLDHLEGEKVQVRADGAYLGEFTVDGGAVTLPRTAKDVQIGLGFNCLVEMLQPEVGGNGTTAQGSSVHVNEVIIRVLDTSAAVVNGQDISFRRFGGDLLDQPPPVFSGDARTTTLSDQIYKTRQVIEQPYPHPFHLLDVIRKITINE